MRKRSRITVAGRVQGVGFRPTVYRHACELGLSGFVTNTPAGVVAEAQGEAAAVDEFVRRVRLSPPRQARVDGLAVEEIAMGDDGAFRILPSRRSGDLQVGIPPDLATCPECARELLDPADRRHRYPFLNCTHCGPRFTIVEALPYDREHTSMAGFDLCPACRAEYENPADRRFDAQPTCCPACGPRLKLVSADGQPLLEGDPLRETMRRLREGAIVAVKSLGGYHLCCDARNDTVVGLLRQRKGREAKPLAVMFASMEELLGHLEADDAEREELESVAAPIVVLRRRAGSTLSTLISPDTNDVGAFLPYTPLHHLLLCEVSPLVMTSGNLSEEPIAKDEDELGRILGRIADYALTHNRPILRRCDDSVVRRVRGKRLFLRRSRGWVPAPVDLPLGGPPVLACGAELKSTFCLTRGPKAFVSQHIGDLTEYASLAFFEEASADLAKLLQIEPAIVAHDLHADYESTRFARSHPAATKTAVQHHHAHIASCMAEHGLTGSVVGVALDGTGLGSDGTIWGGEFLVADLRDFRRAAHFKTYRMPGADEAIRHPIRMAYSALRAEMGGDADRILSRLPASERAVLERLVDTGAHSPWTSSAGRLFDIVSALLGLCDEISYEGQAAIRLQTAAARSGAMRPYGFEVREGVVDFGPAIREIAGNRPGAADATEAAARFHRTVAVACADVCTAVAAKERISDVVLSGGVFQNDLLLTMLSDELKARGLTVYSHHAVPPNDGGISLGQAAVAMARAARS